jgi:hypothetical protein
MDGTLEVRLTDQISVFNLQALLAGIDKVYFSALWLDLADSMAPGHLFPDSYAPAPDQEVWIASLEIGTPNQLTLKGQMKQLARVATFLTIILGAAVAGTEALKNYAEAKAANAETTLHTAQLVALAHQLYRGGKISEDALRHKLDLDNELVDSIVAIRRIVPPQTFAVVPVAGEPRR